MSIVLNGKGNVYQQIVDYYKRYITLGILKPMDKLPSCRALAKDLGINPNTVERAYSQLEKEKYIITIPKKGAYVLYKDERDEFESIKTSIKEIKNIGISKQDLLNIIEDIYEREEN